LFVDSPDGRRKRISVYASTWEDADAERTRLKDLERKGIPVDSTTSTVGQYNAVLVDGDRATERAGDNFSSYELLVRLYVVPGLGKRKMQAQHIRAWLNGLRTTCQCCAQEKDTERAMKGKARCCAKKPAECCGQVAGTGTLRYLLRLVRAALQDAVEEELLARNVARQVKMPTGSIRKVTPWSADEARKFLETARHDRLYALWAVALAIGLRRGEALGLRWADVDLVNGRVVVTKALSRVGADLALRDVKTESSAAAVPLPEELVTILRRHRLDQLGDTQVARGNTLGLVFTTKNGTPLEPRNINRAFETLCRRAGVRSIGSTTSGIRARRCCSRWVSRQRRTRWLLSSKLPSKSRQRRLPDDGKHL
jgi:integrase